MHGKRQREKTLWAQKNHVQTEKIRLFIQFSLLYDYIPRKVLNSEI